MACPNVIINNIRKILLLFGYVILFSGHVLYPQNVSISTQATSKIVKKFIEEIKIGKSHEAIWNITSELDILNNDQRANFLELESKFDILYKTKGSFFGYDILTNVQIGSNIQFVTILLYYEQTPAIVTMVFQKLTGSEKLSILNLSTDIDQINRLLDTSASSDIKKRYNCVDGNTPKIIAAIQQSDIVKIREFMPNLSEEEASKNSKILNGYGNVNNVTTIYYKEIPGKLHDGVYLLSYDKNFIFTHIYEYKPNMTWGVNILSYNSDPIGYLKYFSDFAKEIKNAENRIGRMKGYDH
jgi:hypothetical protein